MTGCTVKVGCTVGDSGMEYIDVEVADCDDSLLKLGFCELSTEGDLPAVRIEAGAAVDTDSPLPLNVGIGCCTCCSAIE